MSKLFCDNCSDLTVEQIREFDITMIKIPYFLDGVLVEDEFEKGFDDVKFFDKMEKGAVASTASLNPIEYEELFAPTLEAGEDVLYIGFSHSMSGTFNNMHTGIEELKKKFPERKITTIDTKQMCMGLGNLIKVVAKKHNEGMSDADIVKFVDAFSPKIMSYVTVDELKYLKRGGRISGLTAFVGGMFNIKPILKMVDGQLTKIDKVKGRKTSLKTISQFLETDSVDLNYPIAISHARCADEVAQMKTDLLAKYPNAEIITPTMGPIIGTHVGPGTIALFFVKK